MASNEGPKAKRTTWPESEKRHFLVICAENTIAEQVCHICRGKFCTL